MELDGLVEALGFAWGTEAVIVVYDVLRLDTESAKQRMLTTCRWILRGALGDAGGAVAQRDLDPARKNSGSP